jgi:GNAT superfamily N-acetyltransferase
VIRDAMADDWRAIWPFFREIVAAGESYSYDRDITERDARALWLLQPPGRTVVATDESGTILGTAKMNPNQMGPAAHVSTASFMVDPRYAGCGVGRALAEEAISWARSAGYRAMQFNAVVQTNTRAIALWQLLGFQILGTVPAGFKHPTKGYVGLHIMYRAL